MRKYNVLVKHFKKRQKHTWPGHGGYPSILPRTISPASNVFCSERSPLSLDLGTDVADVSLALARSADLDAGRFWEDAEAEVLLFLGGLSLPSFELRLWGSGVTIPALDIELAAWICCEPFSRTTSIGKMGLLSDEVMRPEDRCELLAEGTATTFWLLDEGTFWGRSPVFDFWNPSNIRVPGVVPAENMMQSISQIF